MTALVRSRLARILVVVALFAVVTLTAEQVEEEVTVPPSGEARYNPAYAAQLFFDGMGLPATSVPSLDELPATSEVLFIATTQRTRLRRLVEPLFSWVAEGGHLLIVAEPSPYMDAKSNSWDPLLRPFDIYSYNFHDHPEVAELAFRAPTLLEDVPILTVEADGSRCITHMSGTERWMSAFGEDHDCAGMIQVGVGQGLVTVLADGTWTTNDTLGDHDHATALWSLASSWPDRDHATIVFHDVPTSLSSILWERTWTILTSGLVLLGVWIWSAGRRFGPLMPAPSAHRHSLLEHVEGTADFLWRHRLQSTLIAASRLAIRRRGHGSKARDAATWAELTGLEEERIHAALTDDVSHNPLAFTRAIQILERLRRHK